MSNAATRRKHGAPLVRGQATQTEGQAPIITLEQAVAGALGENRQIKSFTIEVAKYDDKLAALRTKRLPEI
ncbi:MAG: hypothetical protein ABL977_05250, partial [Candidatus Eisenbacteria bacterium]